MKLKKKELENYIRIIMQLVCFCLFPAAYSAAFSGCKYVFAQIGAGEMLELTPFVSVALALMAYTVVFGRFFCGFACAFGALGDGLHFLYKRLWKLFKKKPVAIPTALDSKLYLLKYFVLVFYLGASYLNYGDTLQGTSPWDVFSRLHARQFDLSGYWIGLGLLILIMIGMLIVPRFFCRALCPMGAIFSILPVIPFSSLRRDQASCIKGCSACTRVCPAKIELPYGEIGDTRGECFQCGKCTVVCPKKNITDGTKASWPLHIAGIIVKCGILVGLFVLLGV